VKIPEMKCPKVEIPEMKCPQVNCPEGKCPEVKCPQVKCPEMKCPEMICPEVKCPDPSTCTLTTYAFKHHFFKLLTGPRKAFAMKIIDSIHELHIVYQNKYIIPLLEATLDINLKLISEGINWSFLHDIVDQIKKCGIFALDGEPIDFKNCMYNVREKMNFDELYNIYLTIHKNIRKNYQDIKFVKYENLPADMKKTPREVYLSIMDGNRKRIKAIAEMPFLPKEEFNKVLGAFGKTVSLYGSQ
jgi:hypothetical protein